MSQLLIRSCHVPEGYMCANCLSQSVTKVGIELPGWLKRLNIQTILNYFCTVVQASVYQDIVCLSQPSNIHCMRSPIFPNFSTAIASHHLSTTYNVCQYYNKENRCLARYSPRATTTKHFFGPKSSKKCVNCDKS